MKNLRSNRLDDQLVFRCYPHGCALSRHEKKVDRLIDSAPSAEEHEKKLEKASLVFVETKKLLAKYSACYEWSV